MQDAARYALFKMKLTMRGKLSLGEQVVRRAEGVFTGEPHCPTARSVMHAAMTPAMTTPTSSIFLFLRTALVCAPASVSYCGNAIPLYFRRIVLFNIIDFPRFSHG